MSDETLADRIRAGDDASFEVLFDRHNRGLLAFARHMLGDAAEAEDVLQHVFIQAYRTICSDPRELHVKAWLYTVARNRCLSILRKRRESPGELDERMPALDGLSAQVERRSELRELLLDLARVPDDQRAALVLSELGDLGHDDIAAVLGVRRDKVKALVFQAREHLMLNREARLTPCAEIQEELATLRGGQLRRGKVRRHVDQCDACKAFGAEVRRQRAAMALVLPVAPALSLKPSVLGATVGGGGVAAGGAILGAGVLGGVSAAIEGVAAKVLVAAVVATGTGAGGYAALDKLTQEPRVAGGAGGAGSSGAAPKRVTAPPSVAPTSLGRLTTTPAPAPVAPASRSSALRDSAAAAPVARRTPKASNPSRPQTAAPAPAPAAQPAPQAPGSSSPAGQTAPAAVGHTPSSGGRNASSVSGRSGGDTSSTRAGRSGDSGQRSAPSRRSGGGGRKSTPQGGGQAKQGGAPSPAGAKSGGGGGGAKAGGRQQRSGVRGGRSSGGRRGAAPAPAPAPVQAPPAAAAQPAAQPAPTESGGSGKAGRNDSDEGKPGRDGS